MAFAGKSLPDEPEPADREQAAREDAHWNWLLDDPLIELEQLTIPDPQAPDAVEHFISYVYLRENPAGPHRELWYHGAGCQAWLAVERDTRTHVIASVRACRTGR